MASANVVPLVDLKAGVLTLATLALCVGCAPATVPTTPPTPAASPAWETRPPETLTRGGTVRLALSSLPSQWNPWHVDGQSADAEAVRGPLSGQAFTYDAAGIPRANPDFIEDASANGTPTVATLRLNPRAVWADGQGITAADWTATFHAIAAGDRRFTARGAPGWDKIADVRAGENPLEVIITYKEACPDWTMPLAQGPARAESVADPETFNTGWSTYRAAWFNGPFVVTTIDTVQGVITLGRNPRWWGREPLLDTITFRAVPSESKRASFAAGEFDALRVTDPAYAQVTLKGAPNAYLHGAPGTTGRVLVMNTDGTLRDQVLRQALVRAIDRTALARSAPKTANQEADVWNHHLLLPAQAGARDRSEATGLAYNPDNANAVLKAAGWTLTSGVRMRNGAMLKLTITVPATDATAKTEASILAKNLARVGIATEEVTANGDLSFADVHIARYPYSHLPDRYLDSPGFADIAPRIATATNPDELADHAARALWTDARTLPLYVPPAMTAMRAKLENIVAPGWASVRWENVGWAS